MVIILKFKRLFQVDPKFRCYFLDFIGEDERVQEFISYLLGAVFQNEDVVDIFKYKYTDWTSPTRGSYGSKGPNERVFNAGEVIRFKDS